MGEHIDEGSRKHWEQVLATLPKRRGRESVTTLAYDEDELMRDTDDSTGRRFNEEDRDIY